MQRKIVASAEVIWNTEAQIFQCFDSLCETLAPLRETLFLKYYFRFRFCIWLPGSDSDSRKHHYSDEMPRFLQCSVKSSPLQRSLEYRGVKELKNLRPLRNLGAV